MIRDSEAHLHIAGKKLQHLPIESDYSLFRTSILWLCFGCISKTHMKRNQCFPMTAVNALETHPVRNRTHRRIKKECECKTWLKNVGLTWMHVSGCAPEKRDRNGTAADDTHSFILFCLGFSEDSFYICLFHCRYVTVYYIKTAHLFRIGC